MEKLNWEKRIEMAKKNGYFTDDDKNKARDWSTCAVGEQFNVKDFVSIPHTRFISEIEDLGCLFLIYVVDNDITKSEKCFERIKEIKKSIIYFLIG